MRLLCLRAVVMHAWWAHTMCCRHWCNVSCDAERFENHRPPATPSATLPGVDGAGRAHLDRHHARQRWTDGGGWLVHRSDGGSGDSGRVDELLSALGVDPLVRDSAHRRTLP